MISHIHIGGGTNKNHLLACLPGTVRMRWGPHLEHVDLELGQVVHEAQHHAPHVYFPLTAIVSKLYILENGASAEIATVGNEGMVGFALIMGGDTTPSRAVVKNAGTAFRMKADFMKHELQLVPPILHLMLRYTQALITQMAQTAACNRHHTLEQQLCRWLLLSLDRQQGNVLDMTQELIANMLGVRREGITEAAGKLRSAGLIRNRRGHIIVLNRDGLEERSCECYKVVKKEYARLLPDRIAN
jgi:CRP-like cAMP-binding protein